MNGPGNAKLLMAVFLKWKGVMVYFLCPFLSVAVGVCATNLTRFVEKICNIYISK